MRRLDSYQRRHPWLGLPIGVIFKFADDQGSYLAALITYYGFLSVFPLLLISTTALGFALAGNPELQQRLLQSALGEFPVVGDQLAGTVHPLQGSVPALVVGIVVSAYGALRFARALQDALNTVWAIPRRERPNPIRAYSRAALLMVGLGAALLATTAVPAIISALPAFSGALGAVAAVASRLAVTLAAAAINTGVFLLAFRVLTARQIPLRYLRGGALAAGIAWQALQELGTYLVSRQLQGINAAYGLFSVVLGLLTWIYLGAFIIVTAAELNAVRVNRLWPRSLMSAFTEDAELTRGDRRAYAAYAAAQQYTGGQRIEVEFDRAAPEESEQERTSPNLRPVRLGRSGLSGLSGPDDAPPPPGDGEHDEESDEDAGPDGEHG